MMRRKLKMKIIEKCDLKPLGIALTDLIKEYVSNEYQTFTLTFQSKIDADKVYHFQNFGLRKDIALI